MKTIKNTITTAIAGSYFVPKEVQCVRVLELFGRLLLGLNPHGANNYSLNRIGMSGVLKLLYGAIRSQLRKIYASVMDTSSGVRNIIIRKKTLVGMFKIGMGYTRGLETLVALTGVGFQLENIITTMASRKKNLMNNSKSVIQKSIAGLSLTQNFVLLLLLVSAYVGNFVRIQTTREELQGLYMIGVYITSLIEVLMKTFTPIAKKDKRLEAGVFCANR
jgi:small basic protein